MHSDDSNLFHRINNKRNLGSVIWITGLSGAGKSVLALAVVKRLRAVDDKIFLLDGDELREVFGAKTINDKNFSRDKRISLAMQYARLCDVLARQGFTVVIATISLFKEVHAWNRTNLYGYFEVYLKVPLEELRRRDAKGIYRRFDAGELKNVAGLDLPVDEPKLADLVLEFTPGRSLKESVNELLDRLNSTPLI